MKISIGIFAYNEELNIGDILCDLYVQTIFDKNDISIDVHVLANGCVDRTVEMANMTVDGFIQKNEKNFFVHDLPYKGKSRVWTKYVHEISDKESEFICFIDADIRIPESSVLQRMVSELLNRQNCMLINSRPIKDISIVNKKMNIVEKLIAMSSGNLTDYKKSVCGQLYMVKNFALENIYMPVGLPVEDGFLRAMLLTDLLLEKENMEKIDGKEDIFHVYESIRDIYELITHQTRIMIGSAVNEGIYRYLRSLEPNIGIRRDVLMRSSMDDKWLEELILNQFPVWPYGYVSLNLLTKRIRAMKSRERTSIKSRFVTFFGFIFDCVIYVNASLKMFRGRGAGYW